MELKIYEKTIWVPDEGSTQITDSTPQSAFIKNHFKDICKEAAALSVLCEALDIQPEVVVDAMAGCGFSAAVFSHYWPNASLHLNDLSSQCVDILARNYPQATITGTDCALLDYEECALAFVDFNSFTLKNIEHWESLWAPLRKAKMIWITDSASYGFKFNKFQVMWGVESALEYYAELNARMFEVLGLHMTDICVFGNAAVAVFQFKSSPVSFHDLPQSPVSIVENGLIF